MNTLTSLLCVFACIFQLSLGASVPDNSVVNVRKVLRLILENAEVPVQQRQQVQRILDTSSSDSIVPLSGGGYSSQLQSIPAISMDVTVPTTPTVVYDTTGACRGLQPGVDAYRAYSLDSSKYVQCDGELGVVMTCAPGTVWLGDRCDWSYGTKQTLKTLPHRPVQKTAPAGYSNGVPTTPKRLPLQQDVPVSNSYGQQQQQLPQRIVQEVPVPVVQQPPRRVVQDVPVVQSGYGQQQQLQLPQRVLKDEPVPVPVDNTQVANLDTTGACSSNTEGEQGYLPNPLDRSSYIECSGTTGYIMPCSVGLEWDSVNLVCNYPQQQQPPQPQRLTQTAPQSGYGQTPVRIPQRVVQQETAPVPFVPSVPHGYSNQQQRPAPVQVPAPVSNNGYGQLQQLPPVDLTTSTDFVETRVQVTDSTACVNVDPNVFVQLENRVDPTTFILCSHGTGIVMQCPSGTQWVQQGPTAGSCLPPFDGNSQVQLPVQEIRQPVQEMRQPVRLSQNSGYGQQTVQIPERPVVQQPAPIRRPIMSTPQVSVPQSGYGQQQQQLPALPMESTTSILRQDTPPVQSVTDSTVCRNVDSQTDTYLSHPVPSLFVKCSSGVGYVMSCPETTTWNPELVACTTTPSVSVPPQPQPQPPLRLSIPQQESSYGQQPQPVPVPQPPQRLSNGYGSSPMPSLRQPIVPPVVQPVFEPPQTPVLPPVVDTPSSFSVQIDQTNACASMNLGDNVYLPKLDNPNQFIRCDNRVGYVMTCPNNLVWNTEINSCALSQASEQQQQQQPTRLRAPSGFTQQESSYGQQPQPVPVPQPLPQQPQVVPLSYGQQPQQLPQQQVLRQEVAAQMDSTQACARFGPSDDVYIVNSADPSMSTYVRCVGNIGYVMACAPGTLFLGQSSTENPCVPVQTSSGSSSSSGYGQQPQPVPQPPQQPQYQPQQPQYQPQPEPQPQPIPQQPQQPQYQPQQPQQPQQPSYSDYSPAPAAPAYNPPAAAPSYAPAAAPSYGGSSAGGYGYGYDIGNECTPGTYTSHPDPRYFYQCDNGKWKTQYCAPGTIWDQIAYVCVHDPVRLQQLVQMTLQGSGNNGGYGQQGSGSGYGGY